jgi:hypothetical protein
MIRATPILIFAVVSVLSNPLMAQTTPLSRDGRDALKKVFKDSIVDSRLQMPDEPTIAKFKDLVSQTLRCQAVSPKLNRLWQQAGWECRPLAESSVIVVAEKSNQRRGRGIYAIRTDSSSSIVLQAPHRFNDAKTGVIARKIFEEHDVWSMAFNTVHRKEIDLAHTQRHYFHAFTEAVVATRSNAVVIQLHGFSNAGKTNVGKSASLILSDTTKFPGRHARSVAEELKFTFGKSHTRLFPLETRWLGGTDNEQANLMQQLGSVGFLHVEMNPSFRQQLATTASVRALFFASIESGIER